MKIFHFIPYIATGGAEKVIFELIRHSRGKKHESAVVYFGGKEPEGSSFLIPRKSYLRNFRSLARMIRREKPGVINAHMVPTLKYLMLIRLFFPRIHLFYTQHRDLHQFSGFRIQFLYFLCFRLLRIRMISVSHRTDHSVRKLTGNISSEVIHNGVSKPGISEKSGEVEKELSPYRKKGEVVFLFVGRIVYDKNLPLLIEAVKTLRTRRKDFSLIVVGNPPEGERKEFEQLCLESPDNVFFAGERSGVGDFYSLSDCFCLSSRTEALPMAATEALSWGLPVISTEVGGIREIVHDGQNGFIVPSADPENYAQILERYMQLEPEKKERMKQQAHFLWKEGFTAEKMTEKYLHYYRYGY